jgi:hypothetical protein
MVEAKFFVEWAVGVLGRYKKLRHGDLRWDFFLSAQDCQKRKRTTDVSDGYWL